MNCHKVEELINAYIDDEINDLDDSVKNHLTKCPSCKALYEESLAVKSMLANLDLVPLPDDFEETLHEKLMASKVRPIYKNKVLKNIGYVGTIAAVGVIAFMTGLHIDEPMDQVKSENDYATLESANRNLGIHNAGMANQEEAEYDEDMDLGQVEGFAIQDAPDMDDSVQAPDVNEDAYGKINEGVYTLTFSEAFGTSDGIYHYKIDHVDEFIMIESILENYRVYNLERLDRTQMSFQVDGMDIGKLTAELIEKTSINFGVNLEFDSGEKSELVKVIIDLKEE